ncbi:winged helix-turn-helix transcriptional regulator [Plantactinospora sp. DSM 117369]
MEGRGVAIGGGEAGEGFEIGHQGEVELGTNRRDVQARGDEAKVLHGAGAADVAPRVEYELTALGCSLAEAVDHLVLWVRTHQSAIVDNRASFDSSNRR